MTTISERQRARYYIYKRQNKFETFIYIQKSRHFAKSKTICVTFLFTKIHTLHVTQFSMGFLKLAFIYKNQDTLRYVTFLYTKIQALRKKQDNFRYVFLYTKSLTLCVTQFFMKFLKMAQGGAFLSTKNNALSVTFLYPKNIALSVTFLYLKFIV